MSLGSKAPEVSLTTHRTPRALLFNALKNKLHLDEGISSFLNESGLKLNSSSSSSCDASRNTAELSKANSHAWSPVSAIGPILEENEEENIAIGPEPSEAMMEKDNDQVESGIVADCLNPLPDAMDQKVVELERWTIQLLPNRVLNLEGYQKDDCGEMFHQSGPVSKRLDADLIQTVSGQLYRLCGKPHRLSSAKAGLSKNVLRYFHNGFPDNWEDLIISTLNKNPTSSHSGKDNRKTREKMPSAADDLNISVEANGKESNDSPKHVSDPKPTRRSVRFRVPPLAWWACQRIVVDPITLESKIAQEHENAIDFLPSLYFQSGMEIVQNQCPLGKEGSGKNERQSKEVHPQKRSVAAMDFKISRSSKTFVTGRRRVERSNLAGDIDVDMGKNERNKKYSKSVFHKGNITGGLDDSSCRSASISSKNAALSTERRRKLSRKIPKNKETVTTKITCLSDDDDFRIKRTEKRLMSEQTVRVRGKSDGDSQCSLGDINAVEHDGVLKQRRSSKKMHLSSYDSEFLSPYGVEPDSKKVKKQATNEQKSKVSETIDRNPVENIRSRKYSQGQDKGSSSSTLRNCKVVLENCNSEPFVDQASCQRKSNQNYSEAMHQQDCHDRLSFYTPTKTRRETKEDKSCHNSGGRKSSSKHLRQKGSHELIYSKPSPSGKTVVQTRDSQRQLDEEDLFSLLDEDPLKNLPRKPMPSKVFMPVNLSDTDDSDDVDYIFTSDDEG